MSSPESPDDQFPKAPQYDYAAAAPDLPPEPVDRPVEVDWATILLLVTAVLGVITTIIQLADKSGTMEAIRHSRPEWSEKHVRDSYRAGRWMAIFVGGVFFILYVLLVLQLREGKNWVRIVVTVLLAIAVISGLSSVAAPTTAANRTLGLLGLVIDVGVLVLLYLPRSSAYYRPGQR